MKKNLELFWIFFKIGLFTFGGGYAMIPQIKEVVIEKKKWMNEDEMLDIKTILIVRHILGINKIKYLVVFLLLWELFYRHLL